MTNNIVKKVMSVFLCVTLVLTCLPLMLSASAATDNNRVVDASTMNDWEKWFGEDVDSTENAGGVWMDKSVFTNADAFPNNTVTMKDGDNNFLVALSAISSNKEVVGYSTIPTDTMLVLDVSGSMDGSVDELVDATNAAIKSLYDTNMNNRVGVVLYSGNPDFGASTYAQGTKLLLPLDRYTTARDNKYIALDGGSVKVDSDVRTSVGGEITASKAVVGGTYIQSGLYEALLQFEAADTTVESNNFQGGQQRLPILVLMSDGAPTTATNNFAEVNKQYTVGSGWYSYTTDASVAGNGGSTTNSMGFLTQLTASYVLNRMEAHYGCAGEGLFYTLGLGVESTADADIATSVLDPENSTADINGYWYSYLALMDNNALQLSVPRTSGNGNTTVSVYKNTHAVNQNYVDEYFYAEGSDDLNNAFTSIVEEIILQSRYYPTHLEGGHPDFSGYLTFEDKIGEYMEVKDIKGILLGNTLFDGHDFASKLNDSTDGGLGTIENPSALGLEFSESVKTRLGIADNTTAFDLIRKAYQSGQLSYVSATKYSNYIGWYAKADGSYAGFYNEGTTTAPADAVYKIKSYGFLGQAEGNIKDSDMMYMTVQVRTNIESGEQTLIWKIPAALMPIVTYKVALQGNSVASATNVEVTREAADPIRLVFEVGLQSHINELNVSQITDAEHIAADGSRIFWTNYWDNSAEEHKDHVTTIAGFTPL